MISAIPHTSLMRLSSFRGTTLLLIEGRINDGNGKQCTSVTDTGLADRWLGAAVVVLAVPFVAMQFTDEVKWSASDFMFAASCSGTVGLLIELAVRRTNNWVSRGAFAAALAGLLIIWANGALA